MSGYVHEPPVPPYGSPERGDLPCPQLTEIVVGEPVPTQTAEEAAQHLIALYVDETDMWTTELARRVVAAVAPLVRTQVIAEAADAIQSTAYYFYPSPENDYDQGRLDGLRKARDNAAEKLRGL